MAITFVGKAGVTGVGAGENLTIGTVPTGAIIMLSSANQGNASLSTLTVGGESAFLESTHSTGGTSADARCELWWYYSRAGGTNVVVSPTYSASTRHAYSYYIYQGSAATTPLEFTSSGTGTGASPQTATVTVAAGSASRLLFQAVAFVTTATGVGTITIAPGVGQTEEDEEDLPGTASLVAVSEESNDESGQGQTTMTAVGTDVGFSMNWATVGTAIMLPRTVKKVERSQTGFVFHQPRRVR